MVTGTVKTRRPVRLRDANAVRIMDIDWDRLLLAPLHEGMGVDAWIEPADATAFGGRVIRHSPVAAMNPFQGSTVATNLHIFEIQKSVWPSPADGSRLSITSLGVFAIQAARTDEQQPGIWLLDCIPA